MRSIGLQARQKLPDLERRRRTEVAGSNETNSAKIDPRPGSSGGIPWIQYRSGRIECGPQQNQKIVFSQVLHPGRFFAMDKGSIMVPLDCDNLDSTCLQAPQNLLRLTQVRRFYRWPVKQVACNEKDVRLLFDCLLCDISEGRCKVRIRQPAVQPSTTQVEVCNMKQFQCHSSQRLETEATELRLYHKGTEDTEFRD